MTLDNLSFRYRPEAAPVLNGVSLDVRPGEVIGIVWRSGSGKGTLTKLIQRLYAPEQGRLLVDGIDISLIDAAQLRRQVGVVLQENTLFNRSKSDIKFLDYSALGFPGIYSRVPSYEGTIRHRRFTPVRNEFRYRLFLVYLDLAELDRVFAIHPLWSHDRPNLAWFRRTDHFGDPRVALDRAVRELVAARTGRRPEGPVTWGHPRN